jgi:hypothetical protein
MSIANSATPDSRVAVQLGLLANAIIAGAVSYIVIADITVVKPRYTIYGLLWVFVGIIAIWRTTPQPSSTQTRRRAAIVAGLYAAILALAGGVIQFGGSHIGPAFGARVAYILPGWGPAPIITLPFATVVLMPARIIGYLALTYLVYATIIDAAEMAVSSLIGLFSCVSCSWPVIASLVSGAFGGGSTAVSTALGFSYDISTGIFLLTVAILFWRPYKAE